MSGNLHRNSSAPPLFTLLNQPSINMAAAGSRTPSVAGNFNPGKVAGHKIFLDKTKGLASKGQLPLSNASATKIMNFKDEIPSHGKRCHRSPNCV